jgi:hypothetical protein
VLDYHRERVELDPIANRFSAARLITLHTQLQLATEFNEFGLMISDVGHELLAESNNLVQRSEALAKRLEQDGIEPCFAERHRSWCPPAGRVGLSIKSHRTWFAQHYLVKNR